MKTPQNHYTGLEAEITIDKLSFAAIAANYSSPAEHLTRNFKQFAVLLHLAARREYPGIDVLLLTGESNNVRVKVPKNSPIGSPEVVDDVGEFLTYAVKTLLFLPETWAEDPETDSD